MEVYIEYVIIDTLIINFLLLWATIRTIGAKVNRFLLFVSSLFGTVVALLVPLANFSGVMSGIVKGIISIIMVLMVYKYGSFKQFIYAYMLFVSYTFLMGGACYAIIILLGGTWNNISLGDYDAIIPVSIVILTCFVYVFIIFRLTKYIYRRKDMLPFIWTAVIEINGRPYEFKAFLDSGNKLYDKKNNAPVIVLSAYALEKYISKEEIAKLVFGEESKVFHDIHFINFSTVEGKAKKMVVFSPSKVEIKSNDKHNSFDNISVGVTFKRFTDAIDFDCLLNSALV